MSPFGANYRDRDKAFSTKYEEMESASTGTVPSPPEEGTFTFHWKEHSEEHVHHPPSNWSFRCKYCKKYMRGAKTRLVDHFLVGTITYRFL